MMAVPVRQQTTDRSARDPASDQQQLDAGLSNWLENLFGLSTPDGVFTPMADIEETDDAYLVELELPGVKKDDIDMMIADRRLVVAGERKEKERVGILRRRTRSVGRFRYEIVFPGAVDDDAVAATLHEGVLTITVPKASSTRPRHIDVR